MKLSFCLITLNEEENLPRCLKSLEGLADEIVICDSHSRDQTCDIARSFGARVVSEDWKGFVGQKNSVISHASHDWIFSIDADEELSPELRTSLERWKTSPEPHDNEAWFATRCVYYEGAWIRHGDWYPDNVIRLFNRKQARFCGGHVHERIEGPTQFDTLNGDLFHYSYKNREDQMQRIRRYAELWVRSKQESGKTAGPLAPALHATGRFIRGYFLKGGFWDGTRGLTIARLNAYEVWLKYSLLRRASSPVK